MNTLERVAQAATSIINDKRSAHQAPLQASRWEILQRMAGASYGDILQAMRQLCRERRFTGRIDVNRQPLLLPNDNGTNIQD